MVQRAPVAAFDVLWDELAELPDDVVGEIVAGEIRTKPRPDPRHIRAAAERAFEAIDKLTKSP